MGAISPHYYQKTRNLEIFFGASYVCDLSARRPPALPGLSSVPSDCRGNLSSLQSGICLLAVEFLFSDLGPPSLSSHRACLVHTSTANYYLPLNPQRETPTLHMTKYIDRTTPRLSE